MKTLRPFSVVLTLLSGWTLTANELCTEHLLAYHEKEVSLYFRTRASERKTNRTVLLYKNNTPQFETRKYTPWQILNDEPDNWFIRKGDQITFSDGSILTLGEFLGTGSLTQVFAIEEDPHLVVGIPSRPAGCFWSLVMKDYRLYEQTANTARANGYPMIGTQTREGLIFRQRLTPFQSFEGFAKEVQSLKTEEAFTPEQREKGEALIKLVEFLKGRTDGLTDLRQEQIAWRDHEWIFLDFIDFSTNNPLLANGFTRLNTEFIYDLYKGVRHFPKIQKQIYPYIADHDRYIKWREATRKPFETLWF